MGQWLTAVFSLLKIKSFASKQHKATDCHFKKNKYLIVLSCLFYNILFVTKGKVHVFMHKTDRFYVFILCFQYLNYPIFLSSCIDFYNSTETKNSEAMEGKAQIFANSYRLLIFGVISYTVRKGYIIIPSFPLKRGFLLFFSGKCVESKNHLQIFKKIVKSQFKKKMPLASRKTNSTCFSHS